MSRADKACILRFAFGTTVCMALSMAFGWTLSALAPILAAAFLGNRGPRPDLRATLGILLAIALIFGAGLLVTLLLYPYPAVFLLLFCTALYRNYYASACGKPGFVITLMGDALKGLVAILLARQFEIAEPAVSLVGPMPLSTNGGSTVTKDSVDGDQLPPVALVQSCASGPMPSAQE